MSSAVLAATTDSLRDPAFSRARNTPTATASSAVGLTPFTNQDFHKNQVSDLLTSNLEYPLSTLFLSTL